MKERVAVLGFGVTGRSVARHLIKTGIEPVVLDTRPCVAVDAEFDRIEIHWEQHRWCDFNVSKAVLSPGLSMDTCLVQGALRAEVPLCSDIDLFMEAVDVPVIGITGTNGKSTVTALVGHLLKHKGFSVGVGGNLGDAALDLIATDKNCYVIELSSFQLQRSRLHSYQVASILNVSEDHLDQHGSLQNYTRSKQRIYEHAKTTVYNRHDTSTQPSAGVQVSFGLDAAPGADDWGVIENADQRWIACGIEKVCEIDNLTLQGAHNELNIMAAFALVRPWLALEEMASGLTTFSGLRHRFETVASINDVAFIDDSKATNLGATLAALESLPRKNHVLLIAGGDAKGVDLLPLGEAMRGRVKYIATMGKDAAAVEIVASDLTIQYHRCSSIEQAASACFAHAHSGEVVLLSPACASIDMFSSYAERGDRFTQAALDIHRVHQGGGQR